LKLRGGKRADKDVDLFGIDLTQEPTLLLLLLLLLIHKIYSKAPRLCLADKFGAANKIRNHKWKEKQLD
jgi:hypothetical protein